MKTAFAPALFTFALTVAGLVAPAEAADPVKIAVPPCNCGCMVTGQCKCKNCCERTADPTWAPPQKSATQPPVRTVVTTTTTVQSTGCTGSVRSTGCAGSAASTGCNGTGNPTHRPFFRPWLRR